MASSDQLVEAASVETEQSFEEMESFYEPLWRHFDVEGSCDKSIRFGAAEVLGGEEHPLGELMEMGFEEIEIRVIHVESDESGPAVSITARSESVIIPAHKIMSTPLMLRLAVSVDSIDWERSAYFEGAFEGTCEEDDVVVVEEAWKNLESLRDTIAAILQHKMPFKWPKTLECCFDEASSIYDFDDQDFVHFGLSSEQIRALFEGVDPTDSNRIQLLKNLCRIGDILLPRSIPPQPLDENIPEEGVLNAPLAATGKTIMEAADESWGALSRAERVIEEYKQAPPEGRGSLFLSPEHKGRRVLPIVRYQLSLTDRETDQRVA